MFIVYLSIYFLHSSFYLLTNIFSVWRCKNICIWNNKYNIRLESVWIHRSVYPWIWMNSLYHMVIPTLDSRFAKLAWQNSWVSYRKESLCCLRGAKQIFKGFIICLDLKRFLFFYSFGFIKKFLSFSTSNPLFFLSEKIFKYYQSSNSTSDRFFIHDWFNWCNLNTANL